MNFNVTYQLVNQALGQVGTTDLDHRCALLIFIDAVNFLNGNTVSVNQSTILKYHCIIPTVVIVDTCFTHRNQ